MSPEESSFLGRDNLKSGEFTCFALNPYGIVQTKYFPPKIGYCDNIALSTCHSEISEHGGINVLQSFRSTAVAVWICDAQVEVA